MMMTRTPACRTTITTDSSRVSISTPSSSPSLISLRTAISPQVKALDQKKLLVRKNLLFPGGYFEMLKSGWTRREHPNLLMFWYEEIKQDQKFWINTIIKHVGYALSEEKIDELCEALTFR